MKSTYLGMMVLTCSCGILNKAPNQVSQRSASQQAAAEPVVEPAVDKDKIDSAAATPPLNPRLALCSSSNDKKIPLRQAFSALSYQEYLNTIDRIFGINSKSLNLTAAETRLPGSKFLSVSAETQTLTDQQVQRYFFSAEIIANYLADNPNLLTKASCALSSSNCYKQTIDIYLPLLYRRALSDAEKNSFYALSSLGAVNAWRVALNAALSSPSFLYLTEIGDSMDTERRLTSQEFKTRLALLFYRSAYHPDIDVLTEAQYADKNQLQTFLTALINKPEVKSNFEQLFKEWLRTDKIATLSRDAVNNIAFTDAMKASFAEEVRLLVQDYAWNQPSFGDILNSKYSFVNTDISDIYGTSGSASFKKTTLPADRSGLLTTPAVLTLGAKTNHTSIVQRGLYVFEVLTCTTIPPPPGAVNVNISLNESGNIANAEEAHSNNPQCAGCHVRIDPLGRGLENFDQLGIYRSQYANGESVVAAGKYEGTDFASPAELNKILLDNQAFVSCARQKAVEWMLRERNIVNSFCVDSSVVPDQTAFNVKDFLSRYLVSDSFLKFRFAQ